MAKIPGEPKQLPLLAVRDVVVFPHMALPLSVGREKSIKALEAASQQSPKLIFVVAQRHASQENPEPADLYKVGVVAEVIQCLRMPDGTLKVFLQGLRRAQTAEARLSDQGYWLAEIERLAETGAEAFAAGLPAADPETRALMRHVLDAFDRYARAGRRIPPESLAPLAQIEEPSRLADTLAANSAIRIADRQELLEILDPKKRLERLAVKIDAEMDILSLEKKIHSQVRTQIEKTQKEYYLTEQMKAIQKELRQKDDFGKEIDELREKIQAAKMPAAAEEASTKELKRLEKMMPFSPESTVCRSYLDWMIALPWSSETKDNLDIARAQTILDEDHFGLEKAKERILEYLAVCRLTKQLKGPILCFVGPPGVGKTSLARSIARAMDRKFVRMSLGGVRDEAEIRGHRRTYIGSLPGRIVQSLRKAQSRNPVFLLDEIDKMGTDWRGDPAAALLEVLDPEQNSTFMDHYLDAEFDLSHVLFVCTANTTDGIPVSLEDRLETLRFAGYTHREKTLIAQGYLIPKQLKEHGLKPETIEIQDAALDRAVSEYTREAGVRHLERELANLSRKAAKQFVAEQCDRIVVDSANLEKYLGVPKFYSEKTSYNDVGVATGLAWTEHGGEILAIEVVAMPGKGTLLLTGKLGSVMQESAQAALTFVKSIAGSLGAPDSIFKKCDFHIHVPEGATPKDGPSAGIAIATALASLVSGRAVRPGLAMTGEITLTGRVLPIGGLKEKALAAFREEIKTVLYPFGNRKDLEEIPKDVQAQIELVPIRHIREALDAALLPRPAGARRKAPSPYWKTPKARFPRLRAGLHIPTGKTDIAPGISPPAAQPAAGPGLRA